MEKALSQEKCETAGYEKPQGPNQLGRNAMKGLHRILKTGESIVRAFSIIATIAVGCVTVLIFIDIAARNLFNVAFQGAGELSEYLLVAIAFLGLGYAQLTGTHVRVEVVFSRLPERLKRTVNIFILVLLIVFFTVMTLQIGKEVYKAWAEKIFHWGIGWALPTWPVPFVALIGCFLLVISFVIELVREIDKFGGGRL